MSNKCSVSLMNRLKRCWRLGNMHPTHTHTSLSSSSSKPMGPDPHTLPSPVRKTPHRRVLAPCSTSSAVWLYMKYDFCSAFYFYICMYNLLSVLISYWSWELIQKKFMVSNMLFVQLFFVVFASLFCHGFHVKIRNCFQTGVLINILVNDDQNISTIGIHIGTHTAFPKVLFSEGI